MRRYRTIVADPPWEITMNMGAGGRRARATTVPYSMETLEYIKALPVAAMSDDEAHLYLWSTRKLFREGEAVAVARAWGFEPCGELIWGLRNPGMGGFNGNGHEPILIAQRGDLAFPKNALPVGVTFWRQLYAHGKVHSAKPEGLLDLVERVSPAPRFARHRRATGRGRMIPRGYVMTPERVKHIMAVDADLAAFEARVQALRAYADQELEKAKRGGEDAHEHAVEARSALLRALELENGMAT